MKLRIREYSLKQKEDDEELSLMENINNSYFNEEFNELLNEYIIEDDLTLFVFDNCHKIYLVEDMDDIESVKETWGEDTIFYNIDELPRIWEESCSLRFISNWKLDKRYVRQFNGAEFEFID